MVIEIASEIDPALEYRKKLPRYREAEIPEIWIVDPCKQKILVERKAGAGFVSRSESSGRVESTVVPGFWIEASWLRQDELPSTMSCFREILGS